MYSVDSQHGVTTFTDENGEFTISINKGTYTVIATKDGYTVSDKEIVIDAGEEKEVLFNINGIPFFAQQRAISRRLAIWIGSVVEVAVSSYVDDPDGPLDIDSVTVAVNEIEKKMDFNPQSRMYECRISENEFPDGNPELLIGMPFVITAVDERETGNTSDKFYLVRIFSGCPLPIFPSEGDTVTTGGLHLIWQRLRTDFPIVYRAQIFRGWPPIVVWEETTQDTVSSFTLEEGEYFYWVTAEDKHGNLSRSIATRFWID